MGKITNERGEPIKGLQVSKDMPDEVKKQTAPDGSPRVITKELPEKFKKKVEEKTVLRKKRLQEYLQISLQVGAMQDRLAELRKDLNSVGDSIQDAVKNGFKKLRLDRDKTRRWRFDGRTSFIGVYNPPKPKKDTK